MRLPTLQNHEATVHAVHKSFARLTHLLILMGWVLAACSSPEPFEDQTLPTPFPTPVKPTYSVQRGDVIRSAEFFGRMVPVAAQELFFATAGRVDKVYVAQGDPVTSGQLLADLTDLADLQAQWAAASQEAELQEQATRHIVRRAEIDLEVAQLTLEQYKLERRSDFELHIQELQIERAQMALDEVNADPALHTASAKVKQLEAQMALAQLVSPIDGTVIAAVEPGQSVRTTTTAFVIGDPSHLEIRAAVEDALLKELIENMPVSVRLESQPDQTYSGLIWRLPYPYGSGSSENNEDALRIRLDTPPTNWSLGAQVRVTAILGKKLDVLWLPPEALRSAGGHTFVFVQTAAGPKQVNIITGLPTLERVEILEGLTESQVVIGP